MALSTAPLDQPVVLPTTPDAPPTGVVSPYAFLAVPDANRDAINADLLHMWLVGGPPSADSPYTPRELQLYVAQAREWLDAERIRKNKQLNQEDFIARQKLEKESWIDDVQGREAGANADEFMQSFVVPVLFDAARQEQFCEIPAAFLNLRRYQNLPGEEGIAGVEHVTLLDRRQQKPFVKLRAGEAELLDNAFGGGLMGAPGFWQEGSTLRFYRDRGASKLTQPSLRLRGIVRGTRTTSLPEPALILATQDWEIQRYARELALKRKPEDKTNDNNSTTLG